MFKVGEKIVCININSSNLELYKTYIVQKFDKRDTYVMVDDIYYQELRFIPIQEYRKQKLNKLCLK